MGASPMSLILNLSAESSARTNSQKTPELSIAIPSDGTIVDFGAYQARLLLKSLPLTGLRLLALDLRRKEPQDASLFAFGWLRLRGLKIPQTLQSIMANGLNGWSHSPLLTNQDILRGETNPLQQPFGDHDYYVYPEMPGLIHSWSFSYGDCGKQGTAFYGATDERHFYSVFEFDLTRKNLAIAIETHGFDFAHEAAPKPDEEGFSRLAEWIIADCEAELPTLDRAAQLWLERICLHDSRRKPQLALEQIRQKFGPSQPTRGYTSWYYRYTNIDPSWLMNNLIAIRPHSNWQIFQVDDGYQSAIGDWLTPKQEFPNGIAPTLKIAKSEGFTPGLWCAPFVASATSQLFKKHQEWFQYNTNHELVLCGDFPHWGGKFFALDLENQALRSHLSDIITTMCQKWGVGFLKADFLYAAGRISGGGLTRAARAARAHAWLFDLCNANQTLLLSCGGILSSAIGLCHFCRIGADIGLSWGAADSGNHSREQVHTQASLENSITRSFLSQLAFGNDPDVFILRDQGCQMSLAERKALLLVNQMLGDLVFTSDFLEEYDSKHRQALASAEALRDEAQMSRGPAQSIRLINRDTYHVKYLSSSAWIKIGTDPYFEWSANDS